MTNTPNTPVRRSVSFVQKLLTLSLLTVFVALSSCGDGGDGDEDPDSDDLFSNDLAIEKVFDIGNQLNANDIYLSMRFNSSRNTGELRAMIAKSSTIASITKDLITNQPASAYTSFNVTSALITGRLDAQKTDTDGDALALGVDYQIVVYNVTDNTIAQPSTAFSMTEDAPLTGDYVGTWDDNFYTDFGISAKISGDGNSYTGDFYYTNQFAACCGGLTDGNISFTIENGQINNFVYDQDLITYMGGCPGLYDGSGRVEDEIVLSINFGGDDCDGTHVGGIIKLTRVK